MQAAASINTVDEWYSLSSYFSTTNGVSITNA